MVNFQQIVAQIQQGLWCLTEGSALTLVRYDPETVNAAFVQTVFCALLLRIPDLFLYLFLPCCMCAVRQRALHGWHFSSSSDISPSQSPAKDCVPVLLSCDRGGHHEKEDRGQDYGGCLSPVCHLVLRAERPYGLKDEVLGCRWVVVRDSGRQ